MKIAIHGTKNSHPYGGWQEVVTRGTQNLQLDISWIEDAATCLNLNQFDVIFFIYRWPDDLYHAVQMLGELQKLTKTRIVELNDENCFLSIAKILYEIKQYAATHQAKEAYRHLDTARQFEPATTAP